MMYTGCVEVGVGVGVDEDSIIREDGEGEGAIS
jgi:hypothetical protein